MNRKIIIPIAVLTLFVSEVIKANDTLELNSSLLVDGGSLPVQFTCEGEGISPPLNWKNVPDGTQSLVLIMDHQPNNTEKPRPKLERKPEPNPKSEPKSKSEPNPNPNPKPEPKPEFESAHRDDQTPPPPPPPVKSGKPEGLRWYWTEYNIPVDISNIPTGESVGTLGGNVVNDLNEYAPPCSRGPGVKAYTFHLYALSSLLEISGPDPVSEARLRASMKGLVLGTDSLTVNFERSCQSPPKRQLDQNGEKDQRPQERTEPRSNLPLCEEVKGSSSTTEK